MSNKFCVTVESVNDKIIDRVRFEVPVIEATNDIDLDSNIGKLIIKAVHTGFRSMGTYTVAEGREGSSEP